MSARDSLCKIILILNELIKFVIHNLATLTNLTRQLHVFRCIAANSIIRELLNMLNRNQMINEMLQQFPRFRSLFSQDHWPKQQMRNVYAEAVSTPNNFIRLTGLSPVTFDEIYDLFLATASRRIIKKKRRHLSLVKKIFRFY